LIEIIMKIERGSWDSEVGIVTGYGLDNRERGQN
jgi:hypothetical protein